MGESGRPSVNIILAIAATLLTAVAFLFLFFYIGFNNRKNSYEDSKLLAKETSRKAATETEIYFSPALMTSRSLVQKAKLCRKLGADRQEITNMLFEAFNRSSNYLSVWTLWEPNAYDGKDRQHRGDSLCNENGTLGLGFFKYLDSTFIEISTPDDYAENYYAIPKSLGSEVILEPYYYVYHKHHVAFYETSVIVPIIENSQFLGVFGIDIDLKNIQAHLNKVSIYQSGYLSLISNSGVIVSHPDSAWINSNHFHTIKNPDSLIYNSIRKGKELTLETVSEYTHKKVFRFYYPIKLRNAENPWSMMIEIPVEEATIRSKHIMYVAFGTLLIGLSLIIYLIINIIDRRKYEKTIYRTLKKIEESERSYKEIYNSTTEAIFIHDIETGQILDVNNVMLEMFGYDNKTDILNSPSTEFWINKPPYSSVEAREFSIKTIKEGPQVFEWNSKRKNGETFWTEVSLRKTEINGKGIILAVVRDISERKQMEDNLRESEERYKTLIETSQDGISLMDLNGIMLFINRRKINMVGATSAGELIGTSVYKLLTESSIQKLGPLMPELIRNGFMNNIELDVLRLDGTTFSAEFNVTVLKDQKGEPKFLMDTMRDITERKLAEKALQESEEKYRTLMENMNEVVMVVDNEDRVKFVNKKFTEIFGYSMDEIIGEIAYKKLLTPVEHEFIIQTNKDRELNKISQYEMAFTTKDGRKIDFLVSGAPMINSAGVTTGYIGVMTNISDRKKAENDLKESEERYRKLIQAFPDIIMVSDLNGKVLFGNEPLEKIAGISPEDYTNINRKAKIHPDDLHLVSDALKDLLSSSKNHTDIIENRFIDKWGKVHWFSGIIAKIYLNDQLVLQTITRDITEKKNIEEELAKYRSHLELLVRERTDELEAANEELRSNIEELNTQREELETMLENLHLAQNQLIQSEKMASLGVLAAGVAHEINNPLNFISAGITGLENFIYDNLKEKLAEINPLIQGIQEGVNRAAAIVTSLNHYSRRDDHPHIDCDIHSIIENCLTMLNNQLKQRIHVVKNYSKKACHIKGNEGKLHQAMLNIIANSVQAIEDKGTITISTNVLEKEINISIGDNGSGIQKKDLPKILDPFFTTKAPGKGTGLGLSITYNIIREHGGFLEYESKSGEGTIATVRLPLNKKN